MILIRLITIHNRFSSVPNKTFYFENIDDFIKYSKKLKELDFSLKIRVKTSKLNFSQLNKVLSICINDFNDKEFKNKKELMSKYEKSISL